MSKETTAIVLGIWIAILPFLGFPSAWRTVFFVFSGVAVAIIGFLSRTESLSRGDAHAPHHAFVEKDNRRQEPIAQHDREEVGQEVR